jgi:CBS domain-containing protein/uncharacterized membrane protein
VASLDKMPDKPAQELAVALAGPAVNVVIAGGLYLWLYSSGGLLPLREMDHMGGGNFWFNLMVANAVLAAFNLIPAFPMDGGRVLRALLAFNMDKLQATTIAARVGQFLAIVFVFLGFFTNFWLVFIGLFIYLGAGAEAGQESTKAMLAGDAARDVLIRSHTRLLPWETLEKAMQLFQKNPEQGFVVVENDQVQGVLTRKELIKGLSEYGRSSPVSNVMRKDYIILPPDMPLQEVYQKLLANHFSLAPVLEKGQLIGIVDIRGITELIAVKKALAKKPNGGLTSF